MDCWWPCNVCTSSDVHPKNKYIVIRNSWLKIEIREKAQRLFLKKNY